MKRIVFTLLAIFILSSFAISQDSDKSKIPLDFIGSPQDNKITVTTNQLSFFSASIYKVGKKLLRARLRKIKLVDGKLEHTWRIPSVINGNIAFGEKDKVWKEIIGVVDCKLALIGKKVLMIIPARSEELVEEK